MAVVGRAVFTVEASVLITPSSRAQASFSYAAALEPNPRVDHSVEAGAVPNVLVPVPEAPTNMAAFESVTEAIVRRLILNSRRNLFMACEINYLLSQGN